MTGAQNPNASHGLEHRNVPKENLEHENSRWIRNLWHVLYTGAFSFGLFKITTFLGQVISFSSVTLYFFSFAIWFRFWWYDNMRPGYKRKYPCQDHPNAWRTYLLGFFVISLLSAAFYLVEMPLYYMALLTFLYFFKALWHLFHKNLITGDMKCTNNLRLAVVSDAVIAAIFGIYSLFFIVPILLTSFISLPPIMVIDLGSEEFRLIMGFFIIGVVAALEIHYFICQKIIDEIVGTTT